MKFLFYAFLILCLHLVLNSPQDIANLNNILLWTGAWIARKGEWIHGNKNCFNISTFLLERITNAGTLMTTQSLILKKAYDSWKKNVSDTYKTFIKTLKEEIKREEYPLYYFLGVKNPGNENHFFLIEYFQNYIYLYQAYESFYTLDQSLTKLKYFTVEAFEEEFNQLFSTNENTVKSAIKDLFCYDDKYCSTIQSHLGDVKDKQILLFYENLSAYSYKRQINFSSLNKEEIKVIFNYNMRCSDNCVIFK